MNKNKGHEHEVHEEAVVSGPDYYGSVVIENICWCGTAFGRYVDSIL